MKTMSIAERDNQIKAAFTRHVVRLARHKNEDPPKEAEGRVGSALTAEFLAIKKAFSNVWRPTWNTMLSGGEIPSGKSWRCLLCNNAIDYSKKNKNKKS